MNGIMNRGRNAGFRQANQYEERKNSGRLSNVPEDNDNSNSKVDNELGSSFIENVPNLS